MSLQVWLPLNGSLENLGLDSFVFTQSIVAGYESGKIGQAIQMKNSNVDFIVPSLINAKIFSVAFWYKPIEDSAITTNWNKVLRFQTKNADGTSGSDFRFESSYAGNYATANYALSVHNNTTQSLGSIGHEIVNSKGTWHHICFTHTSTDNYTYLDGVQIRYGAGAAGTLTGRIIIAGASPYPNGLMNDLRIYDHALSQREVKELSKGLVAHYPLNDFIGNPNLLLDTTSDAGNSHSTYALANFNFSESLIEGETYTLSCKINTSSERKSVAVYHSGGTIRIMYFTQAPVNETGVYVHTFTATAEMASQTDGTGHGYARVYASNKAGSQSGEAVTGTANVEWMKIEKGSVATPWIPNAQDDLYSAMGLDEGIVYDCSGYGRHLTNNGATVLSDTVRYKTCMNFTGGTSKAYRASEFMGALSVSVWIYPTIKDSMQVMFTDKESYLSFGINSSGRILVTCSENVKTSYANDSFILNVWNHVVVVNRNNVFELWINGIQQPELGYGLTYWANVTDFTIGGRSNNSGNFTGSMSDVRIYCTALSAEDIKALYETSASIDDKGSFRAYEMSEV